MNIKPYQIILVHEDCPEDDGIPTEVIAYAWTHKSAERLKHEVWALQPKGKWMMVLPANWMLWWTINCGTVYTNDGFDEETATFKSTKIAWWRRERMWHELWRLAKKWQRIVSGQHSSNA